MAFQTRRVVMGHDSDGKSVVSSDEVLSAIDRVPGAGGSVTGCEIWSTERMPVDNSPEAGVSQCAGFVDTSIPRNNYVRGGGGTLIRMIEWKPGNPRYTHRTETVDYVIIVSGEIDHQGDGEEKIHLKAGDVLVQRGGIHTWTNNGSIPCVMAAVMIDATPVEINGKKLTTHYPG